MEVTNPCCFGTTVFGEPETIELPSPRDAEQRITVTRAQGEWRPPERLAQFLPEGFAIPLECYTGPDGLRRIIPRCSFEELIDVGAVGGLAVLHGIRGFNEEVDHSYRAMFLIHQHVRGRAHRGTRGMKEHLTREFNYSRDLYVRRPGRLSDGERDVLPHDVGQTSDGEGPHLSVTQLTECGRRAAEEAGYSNPVSRHAIPFGLLEAAKLNPSEVPAEDVPALVRTALFNIDGSSHVPSEEIIQIVTERLLEAIDRHLVEPQEKFDEWFCGASNSIVKQIAQQRRKPGGQLEREEVRQALLHLGWRAYEYVGQCVHALMRTIKNSIPNRLNDEEKRLFEHMHESQPYYGGLPAALLAERMDFLRHAVLAIWDDPENQDHIRVLHKLLQYYTEMAQPRRAADRQSKRQSRPKEQVCHEDSDSADGDTDEGRGVAAEELNSGDVPVTDERNAAVPVQFIDNLHSATSLDDPFSRVGDHLRELQRIECASGCEHWEYRRDGESEKSVAILIRCACGDVERKIQLPIQQFAEHAESVLGWTRSA